MNEDELIISTPLDQSSMIDDWEFNLVDEVINKSIADKDLEEAISFCNSWIAGIKVKGLMLAKALYLIKKNWDVYEIGDNFVDTISARLGIHTHTVTRYCDIWEMLQSAPKEHIPSLQEHNINSLIPIANALAQGHEIDPNTWDKLADAPDAYTIRNILRDEVTHAEPRKNALSLYIDRMGSIWAFAQDEKYFIGSLELSDDRDVVKKAITRIIKNSGIMQQ